MSRKTHRTDYRSGAVSAFSIQPRFEFIKRNTSKAEGSVAGLPTSPFAVLWNGWTDCTPPVRVRSRILLQRKTEAATVREYLVSNDKKMQACIGISV